MGIRSCFFRVCYGFLMRRSTRVKYALLVSGTLGAKTAQERSIISADVGQLSDSEEMPGITFISLSRNII